MAVTRSGGGSGVGPGEGTGEAAGREPGPGAKGATGADTPSLGDLMPWSTAPLRLGRPWVMAPSPAVLTARWERLVRSAGAERDALFGPTRSRTQHSAVSALPGPGSGTGRFVRESGPCPPPVRIGHGPFDEQWLIPDHRLIDRARPELWRVADAHQLFAVEQGYVAPGAGPALLVGAVLPDGHSPAGRPGRIRPLYRRPGGAEPNVAPGLTALLARRYGHEVTAEALLAWAVATARPSPAGCAVPLTADPGLWAAGVELGRLLIGVQSRGARGGAGPRLPGGRRPYVRAAVPDRPGALAYDAEGAALLLGTGRISPVARAAHDFTVGGVRVLELWCGRRTAGPGAGEEQGPGAAAGDAGVWRREWTSELLELVTVLTLLAEAEPRQDALRARVADGALIGRRELREAGVLPAPAAARRPASVFDHHEEGPEGQFALV